MPEQQNTTYKKNEKYMMLQILYTIFRLFFLLLLYFSNWFNTHI